MLFPGPPQTLCSKFLPFKQILINLFPSIQAPNMKAMQKLDEAREKLEETNKEFDNARRKAKQAKINFERCKQER